MAVAIIIDKCAAGIPARFRAGLQQARFFGHIGKRAIAIIVVERILAVVGDEQIVVAVVIVIAHAAGLAPAGAMLQA